MSSYSAYTPRSGAAGLQGATGPTGPTGTQGPTGATGPISWVQDINQDGSSLTAWTQESGSWSVVTSDHFEVTTAATTINRLRYTTQVALSTLVFRADVKMFSGGGFGAGNRVAVGFDWDGSGGGGGFVAMECTGALNPSSTGRIYNEVNMQVTGGATFTNHFNLDQWYTLTVVVRNPVVDTYVDGTYIGTAGAFTTENAPIYPFLYVYNCHGGFKNIGSWHISLP